MLADRGDFMTLIYLSLLDFLLGELDMDAGTDPVDQAAVRRDRGVELQRRDHHRSLTYH